MDTNINAYITQFEQAEHNLKQTVEAQKALKSNIPFFLKKNLVCLKENFPNLYDKFKDYTLQEDYKLTCNANGEPNILYPDGHYLYSATPFSDCRKQVEEFINNFYNFTLISKCQQEKNPFNQLHFNYKNKLFSQISNFTNVLKEHNKFKTIQNNKKIESTPNLFMFGLGLGFHLGCLYELFTPINLYIIEPRSDFFYLSLCVFDYTSLIGYIKSRNLGLKFFIDDNPDRLFKDIDNYTARYQMNFTVNSFYCCHYQSDIFDTLASRLRRDFNSIQPKDGFFDDILIGMYHSFKNITDGTHFLTKNNNLPKDYTSAPLLIVGNGPSLDSELEIIKQNNNKVFIIACGTALTALVNYGIKVDMYVAVERTPDVYTTLLTIKDQNVFNNVLCVAPDTTYPDTLKLFKHKALGFKCTEAMFYSLVLNKKLKRYDDYCTLEHINPLVSNMGLVLATLLKFKEIYLVGVDCGTAYEEAHSQYSMYYKDKKLKNEYSNMILNNNNMSYPGNFTTNVKTNNLFKISIQTMEGIISEHQKQLKFFNASNGAKIEGCIPKHLSEINFEQLKEQNHENFRNFIMEKMTEEIDISIQDFTDILRLKRSNELIDTLIQDLQNLPSSRTEIILRLESHLDYIDSFIKEGLPLCRSALYGSLSLMYCGYVSVLYIQADEQKAIKDANKFIPLVIEFLQKVKEQLPHTYEYSYDYIKRNIKPFIE